jgi:hypothetical protein
MADDAAAAFLDDDAAGLADHGAVAFARLAALAAHLVETRALSCCGAGASDPGKAAAGGVAPGLRARRTRQRLTGRAGSG